MPTGKRWRPATGFLILGSVVVAAVVGACGQETGLPAGIEASVDGREITRSQVERGVGDVKRSPEIGEQLARPSPQEVAICVSGERKRTEAGGLAARSHCRHALERPSAVTLRLLIRMHWYTLEAQRRGLRVPGGTAPLAQRFAVLWPKVVFPAVATAERVSPARVAARFASNPTRYRERTRRFVSSLIAPSLSLARQARARLQAGMPIERVATRLQGSGVRQPYTGLLPTELLEQPAVERMAPRVARGEFGIVRTKDGWQLFRVEIVEAGFQPTLEQARATVEAEVRERQREAAVDGFNDRLRVRYGPVTACAEAYGLPECQG